MKPDKTEGIFQGSLVDSLKDIYTLKSPGVIRKEAWKAHFNLVSIHPFGDGNGRTSRLVMNYIEAYHKMDMTIVLDKLKKSYIESLEETRKLNSDATATSKANFSPLYTFMEKTHREGIRIMKNHIEKNTVKKTRGQGLSFCVF